MSKGSKELIYLKRENVEEISIIGDGNCFYRCLSQIFDHYQENYSYYRLLIYNYIYKNKENLECFFIRSGNENDAEYRSRYYAFINQIRLNNTYAGDFEIAAASIIFQRKIIIYRDNISGYEFLNEYNPTVAKNEPIFICYKNNNHFRVLLINENNGEKNKISNYVFKEKEDKEYFDDVHKKIETINI